MKRIYLSDSEFEHTYEVFRREKTLITGYRGASSFTTPSHKAKYIRRSECKRFQTADGERLLLPGEAARIAVMEAYPEGFSAPSVYNRLELGAPRFYQGQYWGRNIVYMDIKSAYAVIYSAVELDYLYPRSWGKMPLRPPAQRVWNWKPARNAIAGILYSKYLGMSQPGQPKRKIFSISKKLFNPCVWYMTNAVLHEVANIALKLGCIYIATDAFIFPDTAPHAEFREFVESRGLIMGDVYEGKANIAGFHKYHIWGEGGTLKETKPYRTLVRRGTLKPKRTWAISNITDEFSSLTHLTNWSRHAKNEETNR